MKIGLLVYDDDPKAKIEEKVRRAAARYREKYGQAPTACYVHPGMLNGGSHVISGIEVRAERMILPHHLWLGLAEDTPHPKAAANGQTEGAPSPKPAVRRKAEDTTDTKATRRKAA